jgi:hypothetical protein
LDKNSNYFNKRNDFKNLDEDYNFTKIKKEFFKYINKKEIEIKKFIYQYIIILNIFFKEHNLLTHIKGKKGKYTYNYLSFFDLKIFSKLDIIMHINSKIPMISRPLE